MTSLILPTNFAYVALVGAGAAVLNIYQQQVVMNARKASGIKYPQMYADKAQCDASPAAKKFNCAQRAHGNTLEAVPTFLFNLVYAGLYYPRAAAILGAIWLVGRFFYTRSYASGNPDLRNKQGGLLHYVGYIGLWGTTLYTAGRQVYALLQ